MSPRRPRVACIAVLVAVSLSLHAQRPEPLPDALQEMATTERAFAARALAVGWKAAFLEFFSDAAIGFEKGEVNLAKAQIHANPDPSPGMQLVWEPRVGDISATGEIGWLTGPSTTIDPARNKGQPRHAVYTSIWKRQRNGSYRVVMDVGVPTPSAVSFPPGLTRPAYTGRFSGDYDDTTPPLGNADRLLNSVLRSNQARGWRTVVAEAARLHRRNALPLVGERNIARWAASQPAYALADTRFSEAARSGDLGYTWGTYAVPTGRGGPREEGFYVRVWARHSDGQWRLALDVLQPQ